MDSSKPIDIDLLDKFRNNLSFKNMGELRRFLTQERKAWGWLENAPHGDADMQQHFLSKFDIIERLCNDFETSGLSEADLRNHLASLYGSDQPTLLFSETAPGASVGLIRSAYGDADAERAVAFLTQKLAVDFRNLEHFRVWQVLANPSLVKAAGWLDDQKRVLGNARQALRREIDKYAKATDELLAKETRSNLDQVDRYRRLAGRAFASARQQADNLARKAQEKLDDMDRTRGAYAEQMRLQAPVEYWSDKKRGHRKAVLIWGAVLVVYLLASCLIAYRTLDEVWTAIDPNEALTGRHFVMVAGVGALLTLLFWMARLLVRIFLGERHLATDAEERRVMTQAYLALIKEAAASDQERVVILSALFRTAQDGIVKDDGAGELSLPAMVARLLDARR